MSFQRPPAPTGPVFLGALAKGDFFEHPDGRLMEIIWVYPRRGSAEVRMDVRCEGFVRSLSGVSDTVVRKVDTPT